MRLSLINPLFLRRLRSAASRSFVWLVLMRNWLFETGTSKFPYRSRKRSRTDL